jgi:hypothetical protein
MTAHRDVPASPEGPTDADAAAVAWNERYAVGCPVLAFPGSRDGRALNTRTRSAAWVMGGHSAVVMVEGYAGGIALSHVEPIPRSPEGPDEELREAESLTPIQQAAKLSLTDGDLAHLRWCDPWFMPCGRCGKVPVNPPPCAPLLTAEREDAATWRDAYEERYRQHKARADRLARLAQSGASLARLLGYLLAQYERAVDIHAQVRMDTDEDRDLHAHAVEQLRRAAALVRAALVRAALSDPEATP